MIVKVLLKFFGIELTTQKGRTWSSLRFNN